MAVNFAPGPQQNPNAMALALLAARQQGGESSGGASDIEMALRKMMLEKYLGSVGDTSPVQHWTQGLARALQGTIGGLERGRVEYEDKKKEEEYTSARLGRPGLAAALAPPGFAPPAPPPSPPPPGFAPPAPQMRPPGGPDNMSIPPARVQAANAPPPITWGDGQVGEPGSLPPPGPVPSFNDRFSAATSPAPPPLPPASPQMGSNRPTLGQPMVAPQAPQSRPQVDIPPQIAEHIRRLERIGTPKARADADALYTQYGKPQEFKFHTVEGTLFRTGPDGAPVAVAQAEKSPEAYRTAQLMMQNWRQLGYKSPDDPRLHSDVGRRLSGITTPDQQAESAFKKKASELTADDYNDIRKAGRSSREMVGTIQTLGEIGGMFQSGKTAEVIAALGPYAEMFGAKIDGLGPIQAFEAVLQRAAPAMRVPGSGAQSDFELRGFLKGMGSVGNTPEGNAMVQSTLQAIMQHRVGLAEIASDALNGDITQKEADKRMRELPDPFEQWKKFKKTGGGGAAPSQGRTQLGIGWSVD
jgi:hypothetical protein